MWARPNQAILPAGGRDEANLPAQRRGEGRGAENGPWLHPARKRRPKTQSHK